MKHTMRRTFVLINNTAIGGAERRLGRLFARMAETDADVLVINAGLWEKLLAAGIVSGHEKHVWRLAEPCGRLADWIGLRQGTLVFFLRKLDYLLFVCLLLARYALASRRLFHLVLGGAYVALPLMVLRPDHRVVISVTNRNLAAMVGVSWALPIYRFALMRCDGVDALTEGIRLDLLSRRIAGEKIAVPSGSVIDVEHFRPAPSKEPAVVFAGRLIEEKQPLLFLEAVPAIRRAVPAARFFLLGEGPLRVQVEEDLDRLAIRDVVEVDFRPDLASVLGKARVFVSLQRQDNYPSQSLLEAMACGVATVATDVGLTWRLVDEATGIRVKPNPDDLAEAVIRLLRDPQRCDQLGQAARQRVTQEHSEGQYRAHLSGLYAKVAA
jgi:glycosyltransferase involved in cell wall biosynthesis